MSQTTARRPIVWRDAPLHLFDTMVATLFAAGTYSTADIADELDVDEFRVWNARGRLDAVRRP